MWCFCIHLIILFFDSEQVSSVIMQPDLYSWSVWIWFRSWPGHQLSWHLHGIPHSFHMTASIFNPWLYSSLRTLACFMTNSLFSGSGSSISTMEIILCIFQLSQSVPSHFSLSWHILKNISTPTLVWFITIIFPTQSSLRLKSTTRSEVLCMQKLVSWNKPWLLPMLVFIQEVLSW
jgi:hypothetical protein